MNITSSYPNEKSVLGFCNDIQTERKQVSKLKELKKKKIYSMNKASMKDLLQVESYKRNHFKKCPVTLVVCKIIKLQITQQPAYMYI